MKRTLILFTLLVVMISISSAQTSKRQSVPAYPGVIERIQPNGDTLRTYLRGDERNHWLMTEDGWQIGENDKGWLVYVQQKKDGSTKKSCRKAHNAEARSCCEKKWLDKHGIRKEIRK